MPIPTIDQIEARDREADSDLECCIFFLSSAATRWYHTAKPTDPNVITMIPHVTQEGGETEFICYASDARKLSRAIGIPYSTIEIADFDIAFLSLAKTEFGMYADILSRTDITLAV